MDGMAGLEAMGIRMGLISLLHSLWSTQQSIISNSSSLTQIDTSYSISIELVCLSLVNSYNFSPPQSPDNHLTDYFSPIVSP